MMRWHERAHAESEKGFSAGTNAIDIEDAVMALFDQVNHLRDWIRNDPAVALGPNEPGRAFHSRESLCIAEAISVGSKHVRIDRAQIQPYAARPTNGTIKIVIGGPNHGLARRAWAVESNGRKYDVLDLADQCIEDWMQILVVDLQLVPDRESLTTIG